VTLSTAGVAVPDARGARRRPAWIPTLAAALAIVVCVTAGNWQHRRMHEKEALAAQLQAAAVAPAAPLPVGVKDWQPWRFRTVLLTGEFDARHQILLDNKVHDGRVGFDVIAPLALQDGRVVLVDRGWIAAGASRANLPQPAVPAGVLTIRGQVDVPSHGYLRLGSDEAAPSGMLWQHLDPARYAQATGLSVLPIVVHAEDVASTAGLIPDPATPDTGVAKHVGYMVQWYTFAAMTAGLWAWFTLRPRVRGRMARRAGG
jgi:surfeit locus 1 family protein